MFRIDEKVVYGNSGVCIISAVTSRVFKGKSVEYYVLKPIENMSSTVYVPLHNQSLVSKMKRIMTRDEVDQMIMELTENSIEWIAQDNVRRDRFRSIVKSGERKNIMSLIRTLYIKQSELKELGKKMHVADLDILKEAQKVLHDEMAYVLDIETTDVADYILAKMNVVKM